MLTITNLLEQYFRLAFIQTGIDAEAPILLTPTNKINFGDFQINGVIRVAKTLKMPPRELANKVVINLHQIEIAEVKIATIISKIEIAGPGFINITLDNHYLAQYVSNLDALNKYGVKYLPIPNQRIVVDLSAPNLAKEMHVGHLRSTVIGDAIARIFEYMDYPAVIRQNHVGDWGTQFGMLIAYLQEQGTTLQNGSMITAANDKIPQHELHIQDLAVLYQQAKIKFDNDIEFANMARTYVLKLQNYNPADSLSVITRQYWLIFIEHSLRHCQLVYDQLNLKIPLTAENVVRGESYYAQSYTVHGATQSGLAGVIERLRQVTWKNSDGTLHHLLQQSEGAQCVFFAAGELDSNENTPYVVQKSDGGYLYATTDLAALDYRVHELKAQRIIYVVDARQSLHFKQLFYISKKAGFAHTNTQLQHSAFGTMMNEDGKPFKTRDGGVIKLIDLIQAAIDKATILVEQRNPQWSLADKQQLARQLAIGSIKYADLSKSRVSDYVFSFDKMLSFEGNTAPYLLYAYTRIQSILKKAQHNNLTVNTPYKIIITQDIEHNLGLHLAKFADIVNNAAHDCFPHYVCQYLYDLAGLFMQFYEHCPILQNDDVEIQYSRLCLAHLTAAILKVVLNDLLGIEIIDGMRM